MILDGALDHHERYGGKGYPNGKAGTDISFAGRILAVVDVYDALTSKRSYNKTLPPSHALSLMYEMRGQDFCPGYVEMLISMLGVYPPGSLVRLSTKQISVVTEAHPEHKMQPKVVLLTDEHGRRVPPKLIDLSAITTISITDAAPRLAPNVDVLQAINSLH